MKPLYTGLAHLNNVDSNECFIPVQVFQAPPQRRTILATKLTPDYNGTFNVEDHQFFIALPSLVFLVIGKPPKTYGLVVGTSKGPWNLNKYIYPLPFPNTLESSIICLSEDDEDFSCFSALELIEEFYATRYTSCDLYGTLRFRGYAVGVSNFQQWHDLSKQDPHLGEKLLVQRWDDDPFNLKKLQVKQEQPIRSITTDWREP